MSSRLTNSLTSLEKPASFVVNLAFHVFILLTFLTLFFFKYVSKLTASDIDQELKKIVQDQTSNMLDFISTHDKQKQIPWKLVATLADRLVTESSQQNQTIVDNNNSLYDESICTLLMFALAIVLLVVYFVYRKVDLRLKFIVMENVAIFAFVGMIEIYFFANIASKYVPVLPDDAIRDVFGRLQVLLSS